MLDDPWTDLGSVAGLNYRRVLACFVWSGTHCQVGRSPLSLGKLSPAAAATTCVGWLKETGMAAGASLRKDSYQASWGCLPERWSRISEAPNLCLAWLGMNQCSAALLTNAT